MNVPVIRHKLTYIRGIKVLVQIQHFDAAADVDTWKRDQSIRTINNNLGGEASEVSVSR